MENSLIICNCFINILSVNVIVTYANAAQLLKALQAIIKDGIYRDVIEGHC